MAEWLCSSISIGCGHPRSTASRSRWSDPTPGLPPQENTSFRARAAADHLVVEQVGRHPDQREIAEALTDDFVPGGERNEVGEPFERDRVAGVDELADRVGKTEKSTH